MNLCILSLPRSGSTYTYTALKQSKLFDCFFYEPLNTYFPDQTKFIYNAEEEHIELCYENLKYMKKNLKNMNVLMKEVHLFNYIDKKKYKDLIEDYLEFIENNFKILKLTRNDLFSSVLSNLIAKKLNMREIFSNKEKLVQINVFFNIPVEEFSKELLSRKLHHQKIIQYCNHDYELDYDQLSIKKIADVLDIEIKNIDKSKLTVKNRNKRDLVLNYEELEEWYENNKVILL